MKEAMEKCIPKIVEEPGQDIEIKRGDIVLVELNDLDIPNSHIQKHNRPVLIIQNDIGNRHSPMAIGAMITSKEKKEYPMHQDIKLHVESTILYEQLLTFDKTRIIKKIRTLTPEEQIESDYKLKYSLGLIETSILDIDKVEVEKIIHEVTKGGTETFCIVKVTTERNKFKEVIIDYQELEEQGFTKNSPLEEIEKFFQTLKGLKIIKNNWK